MSLVGEIVERKERPAYVRFERKAIEDKPTSRKEGRYIAKDVDFALVTPPYSKDVFKSKVDDWFSQIERDMNDGRIPQEWVDQYKKSYQMWKNGQEIPLSGTPIRGWSVISPAQQETLARMNILTVEDLSQINDEGLKRIGMGAMELKNKASAWLSQANDKGPLTLEVASLKSENEQLKKSVESLTATVERLLSQTREVPMEVESTEITASDIIEAEPKKRGRPKKVA